MVRAHERHLLEREVEGSSPPGRSTSVEGSSGHARAGVVRRRLIALVTLAIVAGGGLRSHADDSRLDLAQVAGADEFPGGTRAREVLASEGFVVLPRYHKQIFSPYIGGPLPHYVTCDSAHYTYQVLFEGGLTDVERAHPGAGGPDRARSPGP